MRKLIKFGALAPTFVALASMKLRSFSSVVSGLKSKGRGDCYYANLKESSLAWKIMLVLSRMELTPSIFKGPNLV